MARGRRHNALTAACPLAHIFARRRAVLIIIADGRQGWKIRKSCINRGIAAQAQNQHKRGRPHALAGIVAHRYRVPRNIISRLGGGAT